MTIRNAPASSVELASLALDLVAVLGRQSAEVLVPRGGQGQEGRHAVLVVGLLDGEIRGGRGIAQQPEPRPVFGQAAEIGVTPIAAREQGRPQLLRHRVLPVGEPDGTHVVGDLGPAEEPERLTDALERDRADLGAVVLLGEGEQQVIGRLPELLPVELQVRGRVEERAAGVGLHELVPPAPMEVSPVLAEHDVHVLDMLRNGELTNDARRRGVSRDQAHGFPEHGTPCGGRVTSCHRRPLRLRRPRTRRLRTRSSPSLRGSRRSCRRS